MAKDRFYRSKPHVNVGLLRPLVELGFTATGSHQLLFSQPLTGADDQRLLERLVEPQPSASGLPTGKRQHKPVSATRPTAKAELLLQLLLELPTRQAILSESRVSRQKQWLANNFRFEME